MCKLRFIILLTFTLFVELFVLEESEKLWLIYRLLVPSSSAELIKWNLAYKVSFFGHCSKMQLIPISQNLGEEKAYPFSVGPVQIFPIQFLWTVKRRIRKSYVKTRYFPMINSSIFFCTSVNLKNDFSITISILKVFR